MKERLCDVSVHGWYKPADRDTFCCWVTCDAEQSLLEIAGNDEWLEQPVRPFFTGTVLPQMLARAQYRVWVAAHGCTPTPNPAVSWSHLK